jgi:hypothetical protein
VDCTQCITHERVHCFQRLACQLPRKEKLTKPKTKGSLLHLVVNSGRNQIKSNSSAQHSPKPNSFRTQLDDLCFQYTAVGQKTKIDNGFDASPQSTFATTSATIFSATVSTSEIRI